MLSLAIIMSLSVSAMAADVQTSSNEAMVIDYLESITSSQKICTELQAIYAHDNDLLHKSSRERHLYGVLAHPAGGEPHRCESRFRGKALPAEAANRARDQSSYSVMP